MQLPDVDKYMHVWVWYKEGLMTLYTTNYLSHFTEYDNNKEETKR